MADYKGAKALNPAHMQAFGNAVVLVDTASVPSTFATTDKAQVLRIPGGTTLTALEFEHTGLDANGVPALTTNIGFEPCGPNTTPAANATYFAAASTAMRAASATQGRLRCNFAPITFEQDVYITVTPAANPATGAAGTITAIATGIAKGVK